MRSVIVTGATGFVGSAVVRALTKRDDTIVHAISSKDDGELLVSENVRWHKADLIDADQVERLMRQLRARHLLHLAWYVEHGKFWSAHENIDWLNASINLFNSFASNGGERAVCAGTCFEYDHSSDGPLNENSSPLQPKSLYGAAKLSMYHLLTEIAKQAGISFGWGRIFFLFGAGEDRRRLVPHVINTLLNGEKAKVSHGRQIRDFADVDHVGEGFAAFLDSGVDGAVNIASGGGIAIRDLVAMIAGKLDREDLVEYGAIPAPENDPAVVLADVSRLRNEVKFSAVPDLDQAIEKTISWWKK